MIKATHIRELIQDIVRVAQGKRDRRIIHPYTDWVIVLLIACVLLVSGSVYAGHLFLKKQSEDIDAYTVRLAPIMYDHRNAQRVIERYEARAAQFESLRGTQSVPAGDTVSIAESVAESDTEGVE